MIMNGGAPRRLPSKGLLALALLAAATLPAWATGTRDNSQQPTPKTQPPQVVKQETQPAQPKPKVAARPERKTKPVIANENVTYVALPLDQTVEEKVARVRELRGTYALHINPVKLPDEGQTLVTNYTADLDAIQKEMEAKIQARREAVIQSLTALQDQYTKAGKLDEAVAIRDYLKAGGPDSKYAVFYRGRK